MWSRIGQMLKSLYSGMTQLEWAMGIFAIAITLAQWHFGYLKIDLKAAIGLIFLLAGLKWVAKIMVSAMQFGLMVFRILEVLTGSRYTR